MSRWALVLIIPVLALAPLLALIRYVWSIWMNPEKATAIAIGLDRVSNAALNGVVTETISSRADRARQEGKRWGCILCKWLDALDPNHCKNSRGV